MNYDTTDHVLWPYEPEENNDYKYDLFDAEYSEIIASRLYAQRMNREDSC